MLKELIELEELKGEKFTVLEVDNAIQGVLYKRDSISKIQYWEEKRKSL